MTCLKFFKVGYNRVVRCYKHRQSLIGMEVRLMTTPNELYREIHLAKGKIIPISLAEWLAESPEESLAEMAKIEGMSNVVWTAEYLYEILKEVN